MAIFSDVFIDVTKYGTKIPQENYLPEGLYQIIDQGQNEIAGYLNNPDGLFTDVPAIIFGDHTRALKYVDKPLFLGADGVKLLKAKDDNANYKYLYYALCSEKIPDTGYNRHFKWLKEVEIPLPDATTQEKIVAVLDTVNALITFHKRQLAKLDELVKARFVELFGDPILNNKNWPMVTLGEIAELRIGPFGTLLHKEDYISGGHALVNPSHIINGTICTDDNLTISDSKYEELSAYQLQIGDIVLGRRGKMGRCAVVRVEGLLCGTGSMIIRPNNQMKPYFLQNIISRPEYKEIIESKAVGITMMNLNVPIVAALSVPLLPLELQDNFTDYMSKIEKLRLTIRQGLDKMETLKRALMQEYFNT